jgi:hypothetical protein
MFPVFSSWIIFGSTLTSETFVANWIAAWSRGDSSALLSGGDGFLFQLDTNAIVASQPVTSVSVIDAPCFL